MGKESYETNQVVSRKRPLDDTSNGRERKKANFRTDQPLLKLLVPNYAAGALIGKGGSLIGEMQDKYGGTIRLSANGECYPGTDERIVVVACGEVSQLVDYNNHIMEKVKIDQNMPIEKRPRDERRGTQVKIVLTNSAAGLLIGKGGLTIKSIQGDTKAKITIGSREEAPVPGERILTMSGSVDQRREGCKRVIEVIAEEPTNMANIQLKYMGGSMGMDMNNAGNFGMGGRQHQPALPNNPMSGFRGGNDMNSAGNYGMGGHRNPPALPSNPIPRFRGGNNMDSLGNFEMGGNQHIQHNQHNQHHPPALPNNPMPGYPGENTMNRSGYPGENTMNSLGNVGMGGHQNQSGGMKLKTTVQVQMEVPNVLVGGIMGKQGQILRELHQCSGAKIRFSAKDEYAPGTTDRILTISGDINQAHAAHDLINQRAEQVRNELSAMPPRR